MTEMKTTIGNAARGRLRTDEIISIRSRCGISIKWFVAIAVLILSLYNVTMQKFQWVNKDVSLFGPAGWSDVKLLIYMTTHLSEDHIAFLPCWKDAVKRMDIFKYADLMIYTSTMPSKRQLRLLPFRNTTIKMYTNPGYQSGAIQAMVDPYLDNASSWFDDYDRSEERRVGKECGP